MALLFLESLPLNTVFIRLCLYWTILKYQKSADLCTWDPLHKGGVIDTHIREDKSFEWLVEIQGVCKQIYNTFNWGKNYENFLQTCADLDIEMKKTYQFSNDSFCQ